MYKILAVVVLLFGVRSCSSQTPLFPVTGYCNLGGSQALVSGINSTNYQQGMIPGCTVTVYLHATQTLATIYADSNSTPLSNPFHGNASTSPNSGAWIFWVAGGAAYDVVGSGGVSPNTYPAPVTLAEVYPGINNLSLSSPPPIGNVAPNTGAFTNLTITGTCTGCNGMIWPGGISSGIAYYTYPNTWGGVYNASNAIPYDYLGTGGTGAGSKDLSDSGAYVTPSFSRLSGTATNAQLPGTGTTTVNGQPCQLGGTCAITTTAGPGGSNKQIQFNDTGVLNGNSAFTYDKATQTFSSGLYNYFGQVGTPSINNCGDFANTNTYACTTNPAVALVGGQTPIILTLGHTNTTTATLDFNGGGNTPIQKWAGGSLVNTVAGDLVAGVNIIVFDTSGNFTCLSCAATTAPGATTSVTTNGTLIAAGACQVQGPVSVSGAPNSARIVWTFRGVPPATWQTGIQVMPAMTASSTVALYLCNPTAGSITPAAATLNLSVLF